MVYSPLEQLILDLFRDNGAADMKKMLLALMGHHAGTTMSTSIDSQGARHAMREEEGESQGLPLQP